MIARNNNSFMSYIITMLLILLGTISLIASPGTTSETSELILKGETKNYSYTKESGDTFWYKIEVTEDGEAVFTINTEETLKMNSIKLYTKDNQDKLTQRSYKHLGDKVSKDEVLIISDLAKGTYYIELTRWSGYGGYSLKYGLLTHLAGSPIRCNVNGSKSIRRGVPTCYTVSLENISNQRTDAFVTTIAFTTDIIFSKAVIPSNNGDIVLKPEDVGKAKDSVQSFFVPYLDPFETYTFKVYVEGVANSNGKIKDQCETQLKETDELQFIGTALIVGVVVTVASDKIKDYVCDKVNEKVDLDANEAKLYANALNLTVEELGMTKQKDGIGVYATKSLIKKGAEKALSLNPVTAVAYKIGDALETVSYVGSSFRRRLYYWFYKETGLIKEDKSQKNIAVADGKFAADKVVASWDPNEKLGFVGYGDNNYIYNAKRLHYIINFENKKEATAPAYRIYIEDALSEVFDVSTVKFESTSHQGDNYYWKTNIIDNKLIWEIEGIELPPNMTPPEGEGYVSFSVELKPEHRVTGTRVENKATIVFDKNPAIVTNTWVNVIDQIEPTTSMQSFKYIKGEDSVTVYCNSNDNEKGSGVRHQLFYVSTDEGQNYSFVGENLNHIKYPIEQNKNINYRFYALGVDNVGNTEQIIPQYIVFNPLVNSVDSPIEFASVSVFPNPSKDIFYIQVLDDYQFDYFNVLSMDGNLLFTQNKFFSNNKDIKIDLTNYPSGVYLVNLIGNNTNNFIKLVKE